MLTYRDRLEQAADYLVLWLQLRAPKDTWNLALNGIKKAYDEFGSPQIVIGGELAPYAVYTNEPWISPKWNGKTNPNEAWIHRAIQDAVPILANIMSGVMTQEEYQAIMNGVL